MKKIVRKKVTPKKFIEGVQAMMSERLDPKFDKCSHIAVLAGPKEVIETMVRLASLESGIPMDWCYSGGRAGIYALGDRKKARNALVMVFPQSDLTSSDIGI